MPDCCRKPICCATLVQRKTIAMGDDVTNGLREQLDDALAAFDQFSVPWTDTILIRSYGLKSRSLDRLAK